MTYEDEIIFEQYFPYRNLSKEERNFLINLILNCKDVNDSEIIINDKCEHMYDLNYLNLVKDNNVIRYEAIVSNSSENRLLNGFIKKHNNKYIVVTNVYRCSDVIDEDDKEYKIIDEFVYKNDKIYRRSRYQDGRYFESEVDLFTDDEIEEFIQNKTDKFKLKR